MTFSTWTFVAGIILTVFGLGVVFAVPIPACELPHLPD